MKYFDNVYGEVEITEPIILELLETRPLQRIKKVNQAGTQLVEPEKKVTRFEHCVGVMLLLKKFGASLEEQIAGLLHDVPHTAFSHAADFIFHEGDSQEYHEKFLRKIVFDSDIPEILKKYGIDPERVTDEDNFSLLEQEIPSLCADRIDYSLRDMLNDKLIGQKESRKFLNAITTFRNKFVLNDVEISTEYARAFMKQYLSSWNAPRTLLAFEILAETLRLAMEKKIINEEDLFLTDEEVLDKLTKGGNSELNKKLLILTPKIQYEFNEDSFDYATRGKVRYIDPDILINETETKKLSEIKPEFSQEIADFTAKVKKGYKIKILT